MFLDNVIFHFYKGGGGVTPLTGPPNLNGFSSIIRGGGVKSFLTNVNKKMVFFNEGFPKQYHTCVDIVGQFTADVAAAPTRGV